MIVPCPLLPLGGTVGIVSPGAWVEPACLDAMKAFLEREGHPTVVHPQNYLRAGALAGSDAARAEALMDAFCDTTLDAIVCARGGEGCFRLLDRLDYDLIRAHAKPFVGFSDITTLLHVFWKKCGFTTFHGPMPMNAENPHNDPRTFPLLLEVLHKGAKTYRFDEAVCVRGGAADGYLTGGCLSLLQTLLGTPNDTPTEGALLFIEDVGEPLYRIDRMLGHLRAAGKLKGLRGLIAGPFLEISDKDRYGLSLRDILLEAAPEDVPVVMNVPCGHGDFNITLPLGVKAYLTVTPQGTELALTP